MTATLTTTGYVFRRGKLDRIDGVHSSTIGPVDVALQAGTVRIRDHGSTVAFQGRSKRLVDAAIAAFVQHVRVPRVVSAEWPGRYYEDYSR